MLHNQSFKDKPHFLGFIITLKVIIKKQNYVKMESLR
jgi:hypothetical protein